jgi:hypothetical protein
LGGPERLLVRATLLVLVLALLGCGEPSPGDADAGPRARDGGPVQWVEDGVYAITWERPRGTSEEPADFERCTHLELSEEALVLVFFVEDATCGEPLTGTRRAPCSCFPGPLAVDGPGRQFCLCPNVGSIYGEISWDGPEGPVVTSLRARSVP